MSDHVANAEPQSESSVVVGGIDCGTNSIRLKIARVNAHGVHDIVPRTLRVVRLGEGVDRTHQINRVFAGQLAVHTIVGITVINRFIAAVIFVHFKAIASGAGSR